MAFGLSSTGLQTKSLADIKEEITNALKAAFGNQINTTEVSVFGQVIGIFSDREFQIWELIDEVFLSQYPDTAIGVALDNAVGITGITRLSAQSSAVSIALFGTVGTLIPEDTAFSVENTPDSVFLSDADVTLITGTDAVQQVDFSAVPSSGVFKLDYDDEKTAAINFDALAADVETAINDMSIFSGVTVTGDFTAGFTLTYAGVAGKQVQPLPTAPSADNTLSDGSPITIVIATTTPGVYQGIADGTADQTGPVQANKKTMTVIDTPVSGLTSAFNISDAVAGRAIETDAELRIRRSGRFTISQAGTPAAIRNTVLGLNDITTTSVQMESVSVIENISIAIDGGGRPGKSFETFVQQTNGVTTRDQEIGEAIFSAKPAGIQSFGTVSVAVIDSQDISHTVFFSRPDTVDIYIIVDVSVDSTYPIDGDTQVKEALVAHGDTLEMGALIVVRPTLDSIINAIPGIIDVSFKIGIAPAPTLEDNIQLSANELSVWSSVNITVNQV